MASNANSLINSGQSSCAPLLTDNSTFFHQNPNDFDNILFFENRKSKCQTPDFQKLFNNGFTEEEHYQEFIQKDPLNKKINCEEIDEIKCDFDFQYFEDELLSEDSNNNNKSKKENE